MFFSIFLLALPVFLFLSVSTNEREAVFEIVSKDTSPLTEATVGLWPSIHQALFFCRFDKIDNKCVAIMIHLGGWGVSLSSHCNNASRPPYGRILKDSIRLLY